jgi:hypothetical protein
MYSFSYIWGVCGTINTAKPKCQFSIYFTFGGYILYSCKGKPDMELFFNWYSGGWSTIESTRHCGHQWPIVPAPGDYDDREISEWLAGETEVLGENLLYAALSTTNPTCCPDANPGRSGGKLASNRLSYGTAWHGALNYIWLHGSRVLSPPFLMDLKIHYPTTLC